MIDVRYRPCYAAFDYGQAGWLPVLIWGYGQRTDLEFQPTEEAALASLREALKGYSHDMDKCRRLHH